MDDSKVDHDRGNDTAKPWLFWGTIGLSAGVGLIGLVAQFVFGISWGVASAILNGGPDADLMQNGNFLLGCTLFSHPIILGFTLLFVAGRKGLSVTNYLALKKVSWKAAGVWTGWMALLIIVMETLIAIFRVPTPDFMINMCSSSSMWLIVLTLVIGAPLIEEVFFRGFMFRGLAASRVGPVGAILITTLGWTLLHAFQYDWFSMLYIALMGLVLGWARFKTGSLWVPLLLHTLNNTLATMIVLLQLKQG